MAAGLAFRSGLAAIAAQTERITLSSESGLFCALLCIVGLAADPLRCRAYLLHTWLGGRTAGQLLAGVEFRFYGQFRLNRKFVRDRELCAVGMTRGFTVTGLFLRTVLAPSAVFLCACRASDLARFRFVVTVPTDAGFLAILPTLTFGFSLPCGNFEWMLKNFSFGTANGYQAVDLLCEGYELSMTVLLPDRGRFREFEESPDAALVDRIIADLTYRTVDLGLPRFEFQSMLRLSDAPKSMPRC